MQLSRRGQKRKDDSSDDSSDDSGESEEAVRPRPSDGNVSSNNAAVQPDPADSGVQPNFSPPADEAGEWECLAQGQLSARCRLDYEVPCSMPADSTKSFISSRCGPRFCYLRTDFVHLLDHA